MIKDLPSYISLAFELIVVVSIIWFAVAAKSRMFVIVIITWTIIQTILGLSGIYRDTTALPPRIFLLDVFPAIVTIVITFLGAKGKMFIDTINLRTLTYFNSIRILVEIVLLLLYKQGWVPVYMTFEGTNFDLFSGITAPLAAYFAFRSPVVNKKLLLGWNILCLLLLLNVVITAILATPSPLQKISFEQPNAAILYFPFNLLPAVVVPLVLFGHLVAIRQLTTKTKS